MTQDKVQFQPTTQERYDDMLAAAPTMLVENRRLNEVNAELLAALEGMLEWARRVTQRNPGMEVFNAVNAIAKVKGGV